MIPMGCYSILDAKSGVYATPFFAQADGLAVRSFSELVENHQTVVSRYPADFSLYRIGQVDLASGTLQPLQNPSFLCQGSQFVKVVPMPKDVIGVEVVPEVQSAPSAQ